MPQKRPSRLILGIGVAVVLLASGTFIVNLPAFQETFGWRISQLQASIKYALSPPGEAAFTPNPTVGAMVQQTMEAYTPTALPPPTSGPTVTPAPSPTATTEPTPLPEAVYLSGVRHEYQKWNNCGPANLSMALSYWGWDGNQRPIAEWVKPNPRDKNVMPYELESFVDDGTSLNAIVRSGGDLDRLKSFIAAGFPVMVEKGFEGPGFEGWMGHYEVVTGFDDTLQRVTVQDSYIMPDLPISYTDLESYWRHFNYTFIVVYPTEREAEVMKLLGPLADETASWEFAAGIASAEIYQLTDRDLFFAWFNRGTNLMRLQDYGGAALAYDEAFKIDAQMAINDPDRRPWRMMWYQTGPYFAYYYTGRYYDVIALADFTIENMSEPAVEESFYWRALAKEGLGDVSGAIVDLEKALKWHPDWEPALSQLRRLGVTS